jgi:hypothetical protein
MVEKLEDINWLDENTDKWFKCWSCGTKYLNDMESEEEHKTCKWCTGEEE